MGLSSSEGVVDGVLSWFIVSKVKEGLGTEKRRLNDFVRV